VVYLPNWKIWVRQLGWWHSILFPIYGKIKNVPNHQPDILWGIVYIWHHFTMSSWSFGNQSHLAKCVSPENWGFVLQNGRLIVVRHCSTNIQNEIAGNWSPLSSSLKIHLNLLSQQPSSWKTWLNTFQLTEQFGRSISFRLSRDRLTAAFLVSAPSVRCKPWTVQPLPSKLT
jgi:hypothetical protein